MSKLSEVDKLILKIDQIYTDLGGESDPNYFDVSKVKDKYDRLRIEINRGIGDIESLLNQKEDLPSDKIQDKYILEGKVEDKLQVLTKQLKEIEIELKAQKKKSTKEDFDQKQSLIDTYNRRYMIIKNRLDGIDVKDTERNENIAKIDELELQIKKQTNNNSIPMREMYKEEEDKINEWDDRERRQNEQLKNIGKGVKDLKNDAREIGREINNVHRAIDNTKKQADKTDAKLQTTNKKLKETLDKIRGSDKICLDIVLICICLGLAAVLYNLITNYL